jgi:glycosyltransferase involved in cell wall biosynthesis
MAPNNVVHLCIWSGDTARALDLVCSRYPGSEIKEFPHRKIRVGSFARRIHLLRSFRGRAIVFYVESLDHFKHKQILGCFHLLHRCHETVLCDKSGSWESIRSIDLFRAVPGILVSILLDVKNLVFWWSYLHLWPKRAVSAAVPGYDEPTIAYLIPSPASLGSGGGAISHIRGFLHGVKAAGITCRVFAGTPLAQDVFANEVVPAQSRPYFFWGAIMLSYNFAFARGVQRYLGMSRPHFLYQRHLAFSVAGALLSRHLEVPLILEYNGSEVWIAEHWDPNPLRRWIRLCEEVTLRSAARIIVVSGVLRDDLVKRGIPADRIRVNPNAVDPDYFYPGCGRSSGRKQLGVDPGEVLVGFVGSFSLWHGIEILQQAIVRLLSGPTPCRLRFVLIGDGLLQGEMRSALASYEKTRQVIFTGPAPRDRVAEYLDASDILVSPHVPMPDGSRFFGSPTKLFEYMAMGKAIVASRLEQLAEVLEHDRTAWLVTPGEVDELAEAILLLAMDPAKRDVLGEAARRAAVEHHSWTRNVSLALGDMTTKTNVSLSARSAEKPVLT